MLVAPGVKQSEIGKVIVIENKIRGEVAGHIEDIVVDKNVGKKMTK